MNRKHAARTAIAIAVALIAAAALAACGSSSSSPQSSTSSSSSGSAASASAGRAKLAACLKQHGVTLPSRPSGAKPPSGGYGQGGGGFFGGGGGAGAPNGNSAQATKFRDAMKACGATFGGGRFGAGGPGGAGTRPSAAALASFTSCVAAHGYKLPKPNTSGNGPIFPRKIESNKTFEAAAKACQSHLRPSAGGSGSAGSSE